MNLHASLFFLFSLLKGKSRERERNPNGRPSSARPWQLNNAVVCFSPRFLGTHRPVIYTHCIYPVFPLSLKARQSCWSIEAKDKKKRKEGSKRISSSFFLGRCTFFFCCCFCCFFEFSLSTVGYTYSFLSSSLFLPIFRLLFGIPSSFGSLVASLLLRLPFSIFLFLPIVVWALYTGLVYSSSSYIINEAKEEVCVFRAKKVVHKSVIRFPRFLGLLCLCSHSAHCCWIVGPGFPILCVGVQLFFLFLFFLRGGGGCRRRKNLKNKKKEIGRNGR